MFKKILIANRGEIACRVLRTLKKMGIHGMAVFSDADADAQHVKLADSAVHIGASPAADSYLDYAKIITIAKAHLVDAIHPGYGFLSENAQFATACLEAGITFIGPPPSAITAMGSKSEAKKLMEKTNVPMLPGYHGNKQSESELLKQAKKIGFPVMLKPAAGGGGKGMRIIHHSEEFSEKLKSAKREALASFNDDSILIEKYLKSPRHIEIQIFADTHGHCIHCLERDCSTQRRHQKIIEEAPAQQLSKEIRDKMGQAAIECAQAIGYVGAGTVEFLYSDGEFYFMEMNTRLQVEHPVTEMILGIDLVEWQIKIANGQALPLAQNKVSAHGHAIEARIYAEDPKNNFLPSIGIIDYLKFPELQDCRIDSGITCNDEISRYYDPMIAKVIAWGKDRHSAIARLIDLLKQSHIAGVKTNIDFIQQVLALPQFKTPGLTTDFVDQHLNCIITDEPYSSLYWAIAGLYCLFDLKLQKPMPSTDTYSPWHCKDAWQLNLANSFSFELEAQGEQRHIEITLDDGYQIKMADQTLKLQGSIKDAVLTIDYDDLRLTLTVYRKGTSITLFGLEKTLYFSIVDLDLRYQNEESLAGQLHSPMPGTVIAVMATPGTYVERGTGLMIIEAMKMEHTIVAPQSGVIKEIFYQTGDLVDEGVELLSLQSENTSEN